MNFSWHRFNTLSHRWRDEVQKGHGALVWLAQAPDMKYHPSVAWITDTSHRSGS